MFLNIFILEFSDERMMAVFSKCFLPRGAWRGLGRISTPGGGLGQIHWLGRAQGPGLALEANTFFGHNVVF